MERDEILEKSRDEFHDRDVFENQVLQQAGNVGAAAAVILSTVLFIVQICVGGGINYGLYAVVFTIFAGTFVVKAVKLKRRHEIGLAVLYSCFALALTAAQLYELLSGAGAA